MINLENLKVVAVPDTIKSRNPRGRWQDVMAQVENLPRGQALTLEIPSGTNMHTIYASIYQAARTWGIKVSVRSNFKEGKVYLMNREDAA